MTSTDARTLPGHLDALFVGGAWVAPSGPDIDRGQPGHRRADRRPYRPAHAADVDPAVAAARGGVRRLGRDPAGRAGRARSPRSPTALAARADEMARLIAPSSARR